MEWKWIIIYFICNNLVRQENVLNHYKFIKKRGFP